MTVAGNMGFSLKLRGERPEIVEEKVRDAAAILGLLPFLDRLPRQLSGGQRQRVAMGRAIVRAPQVFLFDEPLSNLDAGLRAQMRAEIRELHRRLRTTTIYVTHDQIDAMTMAATIVVLRDGVVQQTGSPLEVYDRPANLFVAGFIGVPAMNVVEAQVQAEGGRPVLRLPSGVSLPAPSGFDVAQGVRVAAGIRPEHVVLGDSGFPAEVVAVEPTGAATHVTVRTGEQTIVALLRERVRLSPGDTVRVAVRSQSLHFFEPATGRRIQPAAPAPDRIRFAT
jgi:multiple sugar transport system ATP-binding protein